MPKDLLLAHHYKSTKPEQITVVTVNTRLPVDLKGKSGEAQATGGARQRNKAKNTRHKRRATETEPQDGQCG